MTVEEKYELALKTIYNTLKQKQFYMLDRAIINDILKYIETVEEFIKG